tara:strand:+ start:1439 stop:3583 length:2145 start_codon:yes stop_codon:yes gene_type:complete
MNREEFIQLILFKKEIDSEIVKLSKEINDFPLAYSIINAIDGQSVLIKNLLDPKLYGEIDLSLGEIKRLCIENNKLIKEEGSRFLNDLARVSRVNYKFQEKEELENNPEENIILGIDLGTTNTVISYARGKNVEVIPLRNGERILPSVVSVNKKKKFDVGIIASNQKVLNPKDTFFSVKRFIGRRSYEMKSYVTDYPYKIDVNEDKVKIYSPRLKRKLECEEIIAQILIKAKKDAEAYLKKDIKKCIITVPAYFDSNQRNATQKAALIAGFKKVEKLFDEPTAAAFAYEIESKIKTKTSNTIVCDLGGGTFDISLVNKIGVNANSVSVTATKGDRYLGGDDYTNLLVKKIKELIKIENNQTEFNPSIDAVIRNEALKAKHSLSLKEEVEIQIPFLITKDKESFNFEYTLTRKNFNEFTSSLTIKIERKLKDFLNLKKVASQKISKVVVVGGASRMPVYLELIEKLTGFKPQIDLNPDEIISKGAALYGELCLNEDSSNLIIGVNPISLGTTVETYEGVNGVFDVLIPANTPLPVRRTEEYTTVIDYQEGVNIDICQGERIFSKDNILLGSFNLVNIQKAKKGVPKFDITFELDSDGILKAYSVDKKTKSASSLIIKNSIDLTDEEIERFRKIADKMSEQDESDFHTIKLLSHLSILKEIFDDLKDPKLTDEDNSRIQRIEEVLKTGNATIEELNILIRYLRLLIEMNQFFGDED